MIQIVRRKGKIYFRKKPSTIERPTIAQAESRLKFLEAVKVAGLLSVEEVAELVKGEVVTIGDKEAIKMPDGRILMKHMAYVKYMMDGWSSRNRRVKIPEWLLEISRRYYTALRPKPLVAETK
jgi:hypothetical protein